ncbi:hypothetical protein [Lacihabitans lacunae]|uniref:Uncharacterized protein n=1 Tax=Lacihabitans lacunae TaxID=1028214 RepID=A0ABV7YQP7_9BACT
MDTNEKQKHNLKQFNGVDGKFLLIDPLSISCIEQINQHTVRIVLKSVIDGENISYELNYDLKTIYNVINN